ncbi:Interleukin-12 subunit alpha [Collichthys lucidus]|uniref:Interleukin-12 subunit alpha n=1 Tax=Collichthys lucidus TaxID=240159 RepID=A0A4V6AQL7_COLLU|nr:Interleukin-12 subunit alpha [Collichthys lucidus]
MVKPKKGQETPVNHALTTAVSANFTSCALLLLLTLNWRTSIGHPVRTLSPEMCANCSSLYKSLLTSIAQLRNNSDCLRNIMKDLAYYAAAFESYLETPLQNPVNTTAVLKPVQDTIQSLREVNTAKIWGNDSFNNRLEMCNMLRGFYVRAITINRAMGYISSGDYRK